MQNVDTPPAPATPSTLRTLVMQNVDRALRRDARSTFCTSTGTPVAAPARWTEGAHTAMASGVELLGHGPDVLIQHDGLLVTRPLGEFVPEPPPSAVFETALRMRASSSVRTSI